MKTTISSLLRIGRISFGIILNFLRRIFCWFIFWKIDIPRYFIIRKLKTLNKEDHHSMEEIFCNLLVLRRRIVTIDIDNEFSCEVLFASWISLVQTKSLFASFKSIQSLDLLEHYDICNIHFHFVYSYSTSTSSRQQETRIKTSHSNGCYLCIQCITLVAV